MPVANAMFKASAWCGHTIAVALLTRTYIEDPAPIEMSWDLLFGLAVTAGILWVLGFVFCLVLLVPLVPLFMRGSLEFSFTAFIVVGFTIPALLSLWSWELPVYGGVPPSFETDNAQLVRLLLAHGIVGMLGAASAWMSLKQDTTAARRVCDNRNSGIQHEVSE